MQIADSQATMLANRLRKNRRRLKKWCRREKVSCYRLYDRDIPEIPLTIDWYEGRVHLAEVRRRASESMSPAEHREWLDVLVTAVAEELEVRREAIFVKTRQRQRGKEQYQRQSERGARFVVGEGGHRFLVNLSDYLDTGLFLDHRLTRAMVGDMAEGCRFLNLFAYTGSFTVYAARGGAKSTTTVDLSQNYLEWAKENFNLNGLDREASRHRLVRHDVLMFLQDAAERGERFDLVVADPPTFSNSKKLERDFDVQRDHGQLLEGIRAVLSPRGTIIFSTNRRRFRFADDAAPGFEIEDMSEKTIPDDFRNKRIHRSFRLSRRRKLVTRAVPKRVDTRR